MASSRTTSSSSTNTTTAVNDNLGAQDDKDRFNAVKLKGKIEKASQDAMIDLW